MKRAQGHGLILSIIINMLFRSYWLVLVVILIILHFAAGWPLWLIAIPLAAWFLHALLITLILGWANSSVEEKPKVKQKNINP
ncbi:MAG: hypothetical protein IKF90_12350, partial [Parasporobacterium sp.]|nr:hypothetical protein [Parasporobacterium sp.]